MSLFLFKFILQIKKMQHGYILVSVSWYLSLQDKFLTVAIKFTIQYNELGLNKDMNSSRLILSQWLDTTSSTTTLKEV